MDIEALVGSVSDVPNTSVVPSDGLSGMSGELSDNNSNIDSELGSSLVGEGIVSLGFSSDRFGS